MPYLLPTQYTAYFSQPPSLHPTIYIRHLPPSPPPTSNDNPLPQCTLHTLIYLNDRLFIDPYELEDRWGKSSVTSLSSDTSHTQYPYNQDTVYEDEQVVNPGVRVAGEATETITRTRTIKWSLAPSPAPDLERPVRYGFTRPLPAPPRLPLPLQIHQPYSSNTSSPSSSSSSSSPPSKPTTSMKPNPSISSMNDLSPYVTQYPPESVLHIIQLQPQPHQHQHAPHPTSSKFGATSSSSYDLEIPTHLRYQEPTTPKTNANTDTSTTGYRPVVLRDIIPHGNGTTGNGGQEGQGGDERGEERVGNRQADVVLEIYWSCVAEKIPGGRIPSTTATTHLHLTPGTTTHPHTLEAPAAIASHITFVPPLTLLCVCVAWMCISRAVYRVFTRSRRGREGGVVVVVAVCSAGR